MTAHYDIPFTDDFTGLSDSRPHWRQRFNKFLAHVLAIGMLFVLPEVLHTMGRPVDLPWQIQAGGYLKSLIYIVVFYVNYYFILPRSLKARRGGWSVILYNIGVIAIALLAIWLICHWLEPYWQQVWPGKHHKRPRAGVLAGLRFMISDLVMLVLTVGLSVALKLADNLQSIRQRSQELLTARREQELSSLKEQLNPHFLFNTLNTIYALIAISPDTAQKAVHELSSMLRYVLYDDSDTVPLEREAGFVSSYIRLMELRMAGGTPIEYYVDIATDMEKTPVAPLLFVTLIENAFKHGNTGRRDHPVVITLTAADGVVSCVTSNGISTDSQKPDRPEGGIGLQNLRRRLALIYGDRAQLTVSNDGTLFRTSLTVNLPSKNEKS